MENHVFSATDRLTVADLPHENNANIVKNAATDSTPEKFNERKEESMSNAKTSLKWQWSKGVQATNDTFGELFASFREQTIKCNGRLFTEEEAIQITDEIRKELRGQGERK